MFQLNKRLVLIGIAVLAIIITGVLVFVGSSSGGLVSFFKLNFGKSAETVAKESVDYLNSTVLKDGQSATLESFSEESGVVKLSIKIAGKSYVSYATKDGKLFFPEFLAMGSSKDQANEGGVDISKVNVSTSPFVGDAGAPVVVAEWFDYQCPYCKKFDQEVISQLYDEYIKTGKVRLVLKDYQFLGQDSQTTALAARAVWEAAPDKFYDWNKAVFEKQDDENGGWGDKADILDLTNSLGIDSAKVDQLMTSNAEKYQALIDADKTEGSSFGITGTPAVIVGKQLLSGFKSYTSLKEAVDTALNAK